MCGRVGGPAGERHWGSCTAFPQEWAGPALHTHGEHSSQRHRPRLRVKVLGTLEQHSTSKAVPLPAERQPHSPRQGAEKIICICTAITELSIPQGDHSTESDAEISDAIFQRI